MDEESDDESNTYKPTEEIIKKPYSLSTAIHRLNHD